jgi:hypothetical protein
MNRHSATRVLPATLATVAVLLSACTDNSAGTTGERPNSSPSSPANPGATASSTDRMPVPPDSGALPPGRYGLTANGLPDMPTAVVEVRGPFKSVGQWLLNDAAGAVLSGLGYWTVAGVYRDPCRIESGLLDAGSTAADLAAALGQQKRSRVTAPVPISLDGYDGLYLELQVPKDIDLAQCPYDIWDSTPGGGRYMQEPDQVDRYWIIDVDGDVMVFHATVGAGVPKSRFDQLTEMVESAEFTGPDGSSSP